MRRALIGLMAAAEQLISPPDAQSARVRSPARLEQLWSRLQDYAGSYAPGVPDGQDRRICEVLQEITELVVWGDQNSSRSNSDVSSCANGVVDMFLEPNPQMGKIPYKRGGHDAGAAGRYEEPSRGKRILDDLHELLSPKFKSREIRRQLLQTFNMLVQNINNDQVINIIIVHYIKDIIKYNFDWADEDQVWLRRAFEPIFCFPRACSRLIFTFPCYARFRSGSVKGRWSFSSSLLKSSKNKATGRGRSTWVQKHFLFSPERSDF